MTQSQVLSFTTGFPPAEKLTETLIGIDYRKQFHNFMDTVVIVCAMIAAFATIIAQKWNEYDCTERLQLFVLNMIEKAKTFYAWLKNVAFPAVVDAYNEVRSIYNFVRTV